MEVAIPNKVANDETLVRALLHPLLYSQSKNKIKREAFLPPIEKNDVSVLRLNYSDSNSCKNFAANIVIPNQTYCGLGIVLCGSIREANSEENKLDDGTVISCDVLATPLDERGILSTKEIILATDKGAPMHADIVYSCNHIKQGEPQTILRKMAEKILRKAFAFIDPAPLQPDWTGNDLTLPKIFLDSNKV
jgi:hypothetical protein